MELKTLFVDILLPLHIPEYYTYRVPKELNDFVNVGQSVVVEFGRKKLYSGLIRRVHQKPPPFARVKYIQSILEESPIVTESQFEFWEWIARYYMCYLGDVMAAALPVGFRLESESHILIHPDFDGEISALTKNETEIVLALTHNESLTIKDIIKITGFQKVFPLLQTMKEKGIIVLQEEMESRIKPKTETYLALSETYRIEQNLQTLLEQLEQKKTTQKQVNALLVFLKEKTEDFSIKKEILLDNNVSVSTINTLIKNGIFVVENRVKSRFAEYREQSSPNEIVLNNQQQQAFDNIISQWNEKSVTLLHGVTSSGKTEVYIKLINEVLKQDKQVLFLLPEIALTAQVVNRLRKYFGNTVGVYHSRFNINERAEVWRKIMDKENGFKIILGARSSIFLPFHQLGLIIVDEEHDTSYKQIDPAPRYHARDAAIYLARQHRCKTILGSATPSLESYYNAKEEKYQLVEMPERYGGILMPEVFVADMKEATKKKEVRSHFSLFLLKHITEALKSKKQVILFQNRRGFALRLECDACHWIPECQNCDVSLTYHKGSNVLKCHYCGFTATPPEKCPACGSPMVKMKGFGTEKLEEEMQIFFPDARIARMDLDTTRKKNSYEQILQDFEEKRIDILVGTQMVTKGLDFENVAIVGIMSADNMISFPDFRSFERSFQQMVQVSGRAGRKGERGTVIIQSFNPYHQVIRDTIDSNYLSMYKSQITERQVFKYPPFYRFIKITLKHPNEERLNDGAAFFAQKLRNVFNKRILGPEYPLVPKVRNNYLKNIIIRIEKDISYAHAKDRIWEVIESFGKEKNFSSIVIAIDVDPS